MIPVFIHSLSDDNDNDEGGDDDDGGDEEAGGLQCSAAFLLISAVPKLI